MNLNPNCDGSHCTEHAGEVRVLPLSRDPHHGNLILCRACWYYEIAWRRMRNVSLATDAQFDLPEWSALAVYDSAGESHNGRADEQPTKVGPPAPNPNAGVAPAYPKGRW